MKEKNIKFLNIAIITVLIITAVLVVVLIVGIKLKNDQSFDNYVDNTSSEHPLYQEVTKDEDSLIAEVIDSKINELYDLGITAENLDNYTLTLNNGNNKIIVEYDLGDYQVYITIRHTNLEVDSVTVYSSLDQAS